MIKHLFRRTDAPATEPGSSRGATKSPKPKRDLRIHRSTARMLLFSLIICAFAFTLAFTRAWGESMDRLEAISSTDVFRKIDLETLDGDRFTAENLKDAKLTLVNVWGTSCAPCIMEMPDLETLNNSYPDDIQIIGIADDIVTSEAEPIPEKIDEARDIMSKAGATFPTLIMDKDTYAFMETNIVGTPTTYFVNQDGEIIETITGRKSLNQWKKAVEAELLKL